MQLPPIEVGPSSTTAPPQPVLRKLKHARNFSQNGLFRIRGTSTATIYIRASSCTRKLEIPIFCSKFNKNRSGGRGWAVFEIYGIVNIPLFSIPAPHQSVNRFPSRLCRNTHGYVFVCTFNTNFEVMPPGESHNSVLKFKWHDLNLT